MNKRQELTERIEKLNINIAAAQKIGDSAFILIAARDKLKAQLEAEPEDSVEYTPKRISDKEQLQEISGKRERSYFLDKMDYERYVTLRTRLRDVLRNFHKSRYDPVGTSRVVQDLLDKIHTTIESSCQHIYKDVIITKKRPIGDKTIGKHYSFTSEVFKDFQLPVL